MDSIEHGWRADRATLELIREKGVWLVPTLGPLVNNAAEDGPERQQWQERLRFVQKTVQTAREVGVKIVCGYDPTEESRHGTNARELVALHEAGLSNLEAIRAATLIAAELLELQGDIGSLGPGKFADIIAIAEDPLSSVGALERVFFVMKAGVVVKHESAVD